MAAQSGTHPNLVYVFADQLRYRSVGYNGDRRAITPALDRLATEATSYCNAVSGHPVCAPYRATLFTGKYSTSTGMVINELRMNPHHECFAHVLDEAGYQTSYIGKWHLWANQFGDHDNAHNSFVPPGPYRLGFNGYFAAYNFHHRYYGAYYHLDTIDKIPVPGYEPDAQTDMAIAQLEKAAASGQPCALFLSYGTPHDPWTRDNVPDACYQMLRDEDFPLPPNYLPNDDAHGDRWSRMTAAERAQLPDWTRIYYAMTANLDANVGRLLAALDRLGLRDNTIVVFTSDHGEMLGAHGRRAKNIFYDEAVRVPFLVRWPGHTRAGAETDVCFNSPDIMPTLLGMMGCPIPQAVEGVDLSGHALGRPAPDPEAAFMQGMGSVAVWDDGYEWRAVRSKQYTYAVYRSDGSELLFDNLADPYQRHNLATDPQHVAVRDDLRALLHQRMAELGDTFEQASWYEQHWTKDRLILRSATMDAAGVVQ